MAKQHYGEIHATHSHMTQMMQQIELENRLARKHMKELEHEKIVLEERKMVCFSSTVNIALSPITSDQLP